MSEDLVVRVPVVFKFFVPWASKILLAGFFNDWKGEPMIQKYENGEYFFELVKELDPGHIQYKYIVFFDFGYYEWHYDSSKPTHVDPLGNINNIKQIEGAESIIVEVKSVSSSLSFGEEVIAVRTTKKVVIEEFTIAPEDDVVLAAEAVAIDDDDEPIDIPKVEEEDKEEEPIPEIDVAALEKSIDPALLKKCKATFYAVDKDKSGLIAYEEFISESRRLNVGLSEADLIKKFKEKDLNGDGVISWGEFLLAMVSHSSKKKK